MDLIVNKMIRIKLVEKNQLQQILILEQKTKITVNLVAINV
jgi:hypothetical protein